MKLFIELDIRAKRRDDKKIPEIFSNICDFIFLKNVAKKFQFLILLLNS